MDWAKTTAREHKKHLNFDIWCDLYTRGFTVGTRGMTEESDMASEDRSPTKPLLHWEEILKVLSQPDPLADLIIEVEGHQLYTSKYLLANVSSKFREIFKTAADTDEGPSSLPLPSTPLRAAIDLLRWLLPAESLTISGKLITNSLLLFKKGIKIQDGCVL